VQYYLEKNVLDAALDRIRFLYDEFDEVIVTSSGGKDSTVCFHLAMQVAREKNRLPLNLMFIDQEAEWQNTIDYQRTLFYREDVKPYWLQIPMKMFNSANMEEGYRDLWKPGNKWMREKEPIAIKENTYGTEYFYNIFDSFIRKEFKGKSACYIGGVRCEESPDRRLGLTCKAKYKGETWGKNVSVKEKKYTFYPLYDWSYKDIWAFIARNKIPYNKIYDIQYSYGINERRSMRVSNLHHENAIGDLIRASEFEHETWNKLQEVIKGANSIKHLPETTLCPKELPFMFKDWKEYRDFLLEKLVDDKFKEVFRKRFLQMDQKFERWEYLNLMYNKQIETILINDWYFLILDNLENSREAKNYLNKRRAL